MHLRSRSPLRAGTLVKVRSREEILATLDEDGRLDGMPFMPEMLGYCGQTFQVFKRAHKACDTINYSGIRKIEHTVLLQTRCDGSAHGGCEAACSLFWNEAWLEPAAPAEPMVSSHAEQAPRRVGPCSVEKLIAATRRGFDPVKGPCYACQATEFLSATRPLSAYDPRPYIEDVRSGNIDLATLLHGAVYRVSNFIVRRSERLGQRLGLGDALARPLMACYDGLQKLLPDGVPFPRRKGSIPVGHPTPNLALGQLAPGSWVRVKPYAEILATLDGNNKTRGLLFDAEHVPYCNKEFAVRSLVQQIIDEKSGYMIRFKSPSIILENVFCQGAHSDSRMFCPRAIFPYWRPVWLTPVERGRGAGPAMAPACPPQAAASIPHQRVIWLREASNRCDS